MSITPIIKARYQHLKSGDVYETIKLTKIKISGEWVDGVNYKSMFRSSDNYTRTLDDFGAKFKMIGLIDPAKEKRVEARNDSTI